MADQLIFDEFTVIPEDLDREICYRVLDKNGYLFTLVPDITCYTGGFTVSKLDLALDAEIDWKLVHDLSFKIYNHYC